MTDWAARAARLADELAAAGKLVTPQWQAAVRAVPRHELVPVHFRQDPATGEWTEAATELDLAYSNTVLVTKIGPIHGPWGAAVGALSSASQPGLVTRMLEALDVHDGNRILEIGTGAGYNAALLCYRLGDDNVFSVDIEPDLVDKAREQLSRLGFHPTLAAVDGGAGLPEHAPYDRIIATCSVPSVPWSWVEQVRPDGLILADVKPRFGTGNLALLRRYSDRAEGHFDKTWAGFMTIRHPNDMDEATASTPPQEPGHTRTTTMPIPRPWEHLLFWFFAQPSLPGPVRHRRLRGDDGTLHRTRLAATDGSWCEIDTTDHTDHRTVIEGGPTRLWETLEHAHERWGHADQPTWDRFGLTVTPHHQWAWLDHPASDWHWDLPRESPLTATE